MGVKGPKTGAEIAAKKAKKPAWKGKPPWEKKGLSRAERVVAFCECLPVTAGVHAGRKFVLRDWQKEIINSIYAVDADGNRPIRQAVLSCPRKTGKTAMASALALCHLLGPESEERGQVYSAASDRAQASLIFNEMTAIINRVPQFSERCHIKNFHKEITDFETGSTYTALSSDARKAHGLSPSFWVFDELAQSKSRELFDNLQTGVGARKEPLGIVISTQSADPHHVLSELIDYALAIEEGALPPDPTFYGKIYAAPEDADPWDEATWFACNPALGDFRSLDELKQFAEQAKKMPQKEAVFRSLYLNQRVETAAGFVSNAAYDDCVGEIPDLSNRAIWLGLDLASVSDLTALVGIPEPVPGEPFYVLPWAWCPSDSIRERTRKDRIPYETWRKQGFLEPTKGGVVDYDVILAKIKEIACNYQVKGVCYDRWGSQKIIKELTDLGLEVIEFGQGYASMSPPIKELEKLILNQEIVFPDNPLLKWNFSNLVIEQDAAGNRKFSKGKAREKIDLAVACTMALDAAIRNRVEEFTPSVNWL